MKDIYEVLRQKEAELQKLHKEIEALRVAARLLAEDGDGDGQPEAVLPAVAVGDAAPTSRPQPALVKEGGHSAAWYVDNAPSPRPFP
jgi:hypothetical protein